MRDVFTTRFKLYSIVIVPLLALSFYSFNIFIEKRAVLDEMNNLKNLSYLALEISDLVHELQKERGISSLFLASKEKDFSKKLSKQRLLTDKSFSDLTILLDSFVNVKYGKDFQERLKASITKFGALGAKRNAIDSYTLSLEDSINYFTTVNHGFLETVGLIPSFTTIHEMGNMFLAFHFLQDMKEHSGIVRAILSAVFHMDTFERGLYVKYIESVHEEEYSKKYFLNLGSLKSRAIFFQESSKEVTREVRRMQNIAVEKGTEGGFGIDPEHWFDMKTKEIDNLGRVVFLFSREILEVANAEQKEARYALVISISLSLAAILFAIIIMRNLLHSNKKINQYTAKMEMALRMAEDALTFLLKPPGLTPFFITSPMYHTARTVGGGDALRWIRFRSRYAGVYLHDVSGHDIEETLLNILATALADDCKTNPQKKSVSLPSVFLTDMNKGLTKFCEKTGHFITAVYALMEFDSREIKLSLAGHPAPWLINPDGSMEMVGKQGFMLGQFDINLEDSNRYSDVSLMLKTGQLLLIYSDGLMEEKDENGVEFETKLKGKILPRLKGMEPNDAYNLVKSEFELHLNGGRPEDDVSFVFIGSRPAEKYETLEFRPGPPLLTFIMEHKQYVCPIKNHEPAPLPNSKNIDSESTFREIHHLEDTYKPIIEKLSQDGWSAQKMNEIEVSLGELVINAIMHGNLASDIHNVQISHILHNGILEVSVFDEGKGFDGAKLSQVIEEDDLLKESGRGLSMISMYADTICFNDAGNKCWTIFTKEEALD